MQTDKNEWNVKNDSNKKKSINNTYIHITISYMNIIIMIRPTRITQTLAVQQVKKHTE